MTILGPVGEHGRMRALLPVWGEPESTELCRHSTWRSTHRCTYLPSYIPGQTLTTAPPPGSGCAHTCLHTHVSQAHTVVHQPTHDGSFPVSADWATRCPDTWVWLGGCFWMTLALESANDRVKALPLPSVGGPHPTC